MFQNVNFYFFFLTFIYLFLGGGGEKAWEGRVQEEMAEQSQEEEGSTKERPWHKILSQDFRIMT